MESRSFDGKNTRKENSPLGLSTWGGGIESSKVLERVEIAHTRLNVNLMRDAHETLLTKPYLTFLLDHYSKMIMGFQVSFESPTSTTARLACLNAFSSKQTFLKEMGVDSHWPAHGIPVALVGDNDKVFHEGIFVSALEMLGVSFQYQPVADFQSDGRIERFIHMVNAYLLELLPEATRSVNSENAETPLSVGEFQRLFIVWLTGTYNMLPVEGLNKSPYDLWVSSEKEFPIKVENESNLSSVLL